MKVIRNKQTNHSECYGFIEFANHAAAERALTTYNGALMPQTEQTFKLNWATLGAGQKRQDDSQEHTLFVGDLAADVSDIMLQEAFRAHYPSVKGAKVIMDQMTGRPKGYGFVKFGDENEQTRAMSEMNGAILLSRPMRLGPAANKKLATVQPKGMHVLLYVSLSIFNVRLFGTGVFFCFLDMFKRLINLGALSFRLPLWSLSFPYFTESIFFQFIISFPFGYLYDLGKIFC